ncbi:debranching enzyme-associated ribonuclease, putative [Plasmodium ovale]|uniref:Debranching enzyme-associated ribonuclease, putative n=1 Tax=Plasmodium ovale TaxID=36330 RepID=A0A1C3L5C7_PLAOA|nr:debranching enzyme-associated ribonuclease, putative [Plasmodium ovale]
MSNIDDFYEYAKNNFLNFVNKNKNKSKDGEVKDKNTEKPSRIKGFSEKNLSDMKKLKNDELNDKEGYDEKYKNFLLKGKHKNEKRRRETRKSRINSEEEESSEKTSHESSSSDGATSSSDSSASSSFCSKVKRRKRGGEKEKKKKKHYDSDSGHRKKEVERDRRRRKERKKRKEEKREKKKSKKREKAHKGEGYNEGVKRDDAEGIGGGGDQRCAKGKQEGELNAVYRDTPLRESPGKIHYVENSKLMEKLEKIIAERKRNILEKNALNKNVADCRYCIDSMSFSKVNKLNIISISDKSYICYYSYKNIFLKDQLYISPIEHTTSVTNTNLETIQDMRNHMKSLIAMLEEKNQTCVFIEFNNCFHASIELISLRKTKHTYVNCYVIPMELLEMAKIYFKKNMEDINSLYRENKQLIVTSNKYAPYNVIPKNIPYVSINFSLVETYIQVIENNYDYINMCRCIFADLFKKDRLYKYFRSFNQYVNCVEEFKSLYAKYDWTNYI